MPLPPQDLTEITKEEIDRKIEDRIFQHRHNGNDAQQIDFDDLINNPFGGGGGGHTATFVVGPSSNVDSSAYNFVTDGIDDNVQLQQAIDDLPSTGGRIILREGTYTLGATVTFSKDGVMMQGQGTGTIVTIGTNFNSDMFAFGHASLTFTDCVIKDIKFDGNSGNQSASGIILANNLAVPMQNFSVLNCFLKDAEDAAIEFSNASTDHFLIQGNHFDGWEDEAAINLLGTANKGIISDNYFTNSSTTRIFIDGIKASGVSILNNKFNAPNSYNATLLSGGDIAEGNKIVIGSSAGASCVAIADFSSFVTGNNIEFGASSNVGSRGISNSTRVRANYINGGGIGIIVDASSDIFVGGNDLQGLQADGIDINGTAECLVVGNVINAGEGTDNTYSGIKIQVATSKCVISANIIPTKAGTNDLQYGIRETGTGTGPNVITSNVVLNGQTAKISTQHADTVVAHNITA